MQKLSLEASWSQKDNRDLKGKITAYKNKGKKKRKSSSGGAPSGLHIEVYVKIYSASTECDIWR